MGKRTILIITFLFFCILLIACGKEDGKMSDQEKAEQFAKEMHPKMKERIYAEDYNEFVRQIHFNNSVKISPMGFIEVSGFINHKKELRFNFTLNYKDKNNVNTYNFSDNLAQKMGNFDKKKQAPLPSEQNSSLEHTSLSTLSNLKKTNKLDFSKGRKTLDLPDKTNNLEL